MFRYKLKLRVVIPVIVLVFFTLTSFVAGVIHVYDEISLTEKQVEKHVRITMFQLQSALNRFIPQGMETMVSSHISDIYIDPNIKFFVVVSPDSTVQYSNYSEFKGLHYADFPHFDSTVVGLLQTNAKPIIRLENNQLQGYYPINYGLAEGELRESNKGVLFFVYDYSKVIGEAVGHALIKSSVFFIAGILLSVLLSIAFMYMITTRISNISSGLSQVAQGNYHTVEYAGSDEIAELALGFNAMVKQISEKSKGLEQTQFMIDHSSEAVYLITPNGDFKYVNTEAAKMTGYSVSKLNAMSVFSLDGNMTPDLWKGHWDELSRVKSIFLESVHISKEGDEIPVEISANYFRFDDEEYNCAFVRDISERKKYELEILTQNTEYLSLSEDYREQNEDLLRAVAKAKESDTLKTAFLQNMSHEIRTPLNGIMGFSDILASSNNFEQCVEYAQLIKQSGRQLINLVNDIWDISKLESGQMKLQINVFDLIPEIKDAINLYKTQAEENENTVSFCSSNLPVLYINSDRQRIAQILDNLLSNACKFTSKGNVDVSVKMKTESNVEIMVKDTGVGIEEDQLSKIFDSFYQVDASASRSHEGTGLGLAISNLLANMLGGSLNVVSKIGEGSCFTFEVPFQKYLNMNATNIQEILAEDECVSTITSLLLVDEDEFNAEIVKDLYDNVSVDVVESIADSVNLLTTGKHYDAIIVDLNVFDFNEIQKIEPFASQIPIIAQTMFISIDEIQEALSKGCFDFVPKPIDSQELLLKIRAFQKR